MTIGAHNPSGSLGAHSLLLLAALLALALTIYVAYRLAAPLVERLGDAGVNALVKLNVRAGLY